MFKTGGLQKINRSQSWLPFANEAAPTHSTFSSESKLERNTVRLRVDFVKVGSNLLALNTYALGRDREIRTVDLLKHFSQCVQIETEGAHHCIGRGRPSNSIEDEPHHEQTEQNPDDSIAGYGERRLYGELLEIDEVESQGELNTEVGEA